MDRQLTPTELQLLKDTRTSGVKFIEIFKNDTLEAEGRNNHIAPSLYEMVLLELTAQAEVHKKLIVEQGITIERLKRKLDLGK